MKSKTARNAAPSTSRTTGSSEPSNAATLSSVGINGTSNSSLRLTAPRLLAVALLSLLVVMFSFSAGSGPSAPTGFGETRTDSNIDLQVTSAASAGKGGGKGAEDVESEGTLRRNNAKKPTLLAPDSNDHSNGGQSDAAATAKGRGSQSSSAYDAASTNALQSVVCPDISPPTTFANLTSFPFWGTTMNTSSPCPTSGMNNQISMLLGLMYCATQQRNRIAFTGSGTVASDTEDDHLIPHSLVESFLAPDGNSNSASQAEASSPSASPAAAVALPFQLFRFKDISCTPTGGKEGRKSFKVGSSDYEYAWFRWSEIFDFGGRGALGAVRQHNPSGSAFAALVDGHAATAAENDGGGGGSAGLGGGEIAAPTAAVPTVRVCLRDDFTWSEHRWMKARGCLTTVDHFYGTAAYWRLRALMPLHRWYYALAAEFLRYARRGRGGDGGVLIDEEKEEKNSTVLKKNRSNRRQQLSINQEKTLAIHVRRGDYVNFCQGTASSSGVKKFRIAPFVWFKRGHAKSEAQGLGDMAARRRACCGKGKGELVEAADRDESNPIKDVMLMKSSSGGEGIGGSQTVSSRLQQQRRSMPPPMPHYNSKLLNITSVETLSSRFMDSCAPSDDRVLSLVSRVLESNWRACEDDPIVPEGEGESDGGGGSARRFGGANAVVFEKDVEGGSSDVRAALGDDAPPPPRCIDTVLVMTNSAEFYAKIRSHFAALARPAAAAAAGLFDEKLRALRVVSMRDWLPKKEEGSAASDEASANNSDDLSFGSAMSRVRWPTRRPIGDEEKKKAPQQQHHRSLSTTEASVMDVALLSLAGTAILNRYSTFSQSAIDLRAAREGTLEGMRLFWW